MIPFNKPYLTGAEAEFIQTALSSGKLSGDGSFTARCQHFFETRYGFRRVMLTSSCTDALEMSALLLNIQPGDEVIVPSYTFVSSANAFVLRGAKIVFADSSAKNPNIDADKIEELITKKTKAIVTVHYAGIACDMDKICAIAEKNNIYIIEDAAHAIDAYHNGRALGSIGHIGTISFHETKNIIAGEGGLIAVNESSLEKKAEIIREKGTNRSAFLRGETDRYNWVEAGSSYLPSEITAAFLYAQLQQIDTIQKKRKAIWERYYNNLSSLAAKGVQLPFVPKYAKQNGSIFYLVCREKVERDRLVGWLKERNIISSFHYLALHQSPYYADKYSGKELVNAVHYTNCLVRLPLFFELNVEDVDYISNQVVKFFST